MTKGVWINADRTRVVPEGSPEAAFRLHVADAEALGIEVKPKVEPEAEPKPKQARRPADKMVRKPADKGG